MNLPAYHDIRLRLSRALLAGDQVHTHRKRQGTSTGEHKGQGGPLNERPDHSPHPRSALPGM